MKTRQRHRLSGLVRAFCVLSLILAAFAHRPAFAYEPDAAATAFVFPDGSVASNCVTGADSDGEHDGFSGHCEFCRIAGGFALPTPPDAFQSCAVTVAASHALPADDVPVRHGFPVNAPPRGPPLA